MATQWTAGLSALTPLPAATLNTIGAAWENWTPQLWQGANLTSTIAYGKYARIQKIIIASAYLTCTQAGTAGQQIQIRNLPFNAASFDGISGSYTYLDAGTQFYSGSVVGATVSALGFYFQAGGNFLGAAVTLAVNDWIRFDTVYEAA